jgi:hypothetical protein
MATEQTPLLVDCPDDIENETHSSDGNAAQGGTPIIEEPSAFELALTMSCIWVCNCPLSCFIISF